MASNFEFSNRRIAINMLFSVIAFILNLFINFFISPYIISNLGSDAYGFVKLANDFTNYASLASIALNSMASRFIMLKREQGDSNGASMYYSSVGIANIILSAIFVIPSVLCVCYLENLLNIPVALVTEVKLTFALTFTGFLMNLVFTTFGNTYYLTNRLDISSVQSMISHLLRVGVIVGLYTIFTPKISYLVLGSLVSSVYVICTNLYYHRKLTPELKLHYSRFRWGAVLEVISTGVWNSITKLSQIFSSGLDLLVTNLLVGSTEMGYLSVAKTVPNLLASFNTTIASAFSPNMMMLYARNDIDELARTTKRAMRFMCLFVTVPSAILISMGEEFFQLWVPGQPAKMINILSILTIINSCITGPLQPVYQIFTITNKVKQSSKVMIGYGFSSILITYICLKTTNLGVYAVAGVSLVGSILVALGFHAPFGAKHLGLPIYTFFPELIKSVICLVVVTLVGKGMNLIFSMNTWISWFAVAILTGLIGIALNAVIILNKQERIILKEMFIHKIMRKK